VRSANKPCQLVQVLLFRILGALRNCTKTQLKPSCPSLVESSIHTVAWSYHRRGCSKIEREGTLIQGRSQSDDDDVLW
jgi:hypothetical protein